MFVSPRRSDLCHCDVEFAKGSAIDDKAWLTLMVCVDL
jgi:hypothetical protein